MSDAYFQPPLIPGINTNGTLAGGSYGVGANPFYNVANQFLPRNLHDIIRWSRYIIMQSPVVTEVLRKLSTYPITDFIIDTESEEVKKKYLEIFRSFRLKQRLHNIGFEFHSIGNVFISIYFPIYRALSCPVCKTSVNIKKVDFVKFKNYKFHGICPKCMSTVNFDVMDSKSTSIADMNIIQWDPTHIVTNHNPITGEYEYFYTIPGDIKKRIMNGDRLFLDTVPWSLVEAVRNNQDYKFEHDSIFHLRNISASQAINGVAVPPLVSVFSLVFYQACLRRANESIATDFMSPMRVIFPSPQTANSDPVVSISMSTFVSKMEAAMSAHKRDKNHVLIAPVPIGYQAISGEGKNLLVSQEIQQAEESILLSLGVSRELLSGTTNWTSSTVGLRLLQNTLECYTGQILEVMEWLMTRVSRYLGIPYAEVTLVPFKLTDDDNLRVALLALVQQNKASATTLFESFGLDYAEEVEKMEKEAVIVAKSQIKTKLKVEQSQFLASKESGKDFDADTDYKDNLAKAQQMAEQLYGADEATRRAALNDLKLADYSQFVMVSKLLEEEEAQGAEQEGAGQPGAAKPGQAAQGEQEQTSPPVPGQESEGKAPSGKPKGEEVQSGHHKITINIGEKEKGKTDVKTEKSVTPSNKPKQPK